MSSVSTLITPPAIPAIPAVPAVTAMIILPTVAKSPIFTKVSAINKIPDFPFKKLFMSEADLIKRIANLQSYKPQIVAESIKINGALHRDYFKYEGSPKSIILPANEYEDYNLISDYFTEDVRLSCYKSYRPISPLNWWNKNYKQVYDAVKSKGIDPNDTNRFDYELRETEYYMYKFECESFKPSNAVAFIVMFNAKSVLDISSGWGDRLIACLAKNVQYVGCDPNINLTKGYNEIVNFFASKLNINPKVKIFPEGFLESNISALYESGQFIRPDLVITSPPYFDLEIYTREANQSIVQYKTLNTWLNGFLIPAMEKAYNLLISNGHMVINIEDDLNNKYVKIMIDTFNRKYPGSFLGTIVISKSLNSIGRPFFVWRKI